MYREAPQHVSATERDGTEKSPRYVFKVTSVGLDKIQALNVTITIFTNAAFDIGNQAGIFVDNLDVQFCPHYTWRHLRDCPVAVMNTVKIALNTRMLPPRTELQVSRIIRSNKVSSLM